MKKVFKKLGITVIIIITTLMLLKSTFSPYEVLADAASDEADSLAKMEVMGDVGDFLLGLALYIPKAIGMALGSLLRFLVWGVTAIGGDGINSVDQIIFGEANLTSIDFFDTDSGNDTINKLRANVAIWYYILRNLSIVILLGILLYVGIRMAISTVASDQAKYKKMFMDWAVSLALVFVLQYIMIFTIGCNDVLVDVLKEAKENIQQLEAEEEGEGKTYDNALDQIAGQAWNVSFTVGVSSALVYIILVGITIMFLIMYIKRMLTIGFLIVISPLITITYSIDRMGDGKSQALNTWLKEFVFNVLIQPFHCIIYLVFTSTAVNLLTEQKTLASAVLSICMILFIFKGEKIVRDIFNFRASSLGEAIGGAAAITTGISILKNKSEKDKKNKVDTKKLPTMNNPGDKTGGTSAGGVGSGRASSGGTSSGGTSSGGTSSGGAGSGGAGSGGAGSGGAGSGGAGSGGAGSGGASSGGAGSGGTSSGGADLGVTSSGGSKFGKAVKAMAKVASVPLHPLRTIKGVTGTAFNGVAKAYGKLPEGMRKSLASSAKIATIGTMAALGASTGSGKSIMPALYAGRSMTEGAGAIASDRRANNIVMQNEQALAQAYQNYKAQNPGLTDNQIAMQTEQWLEHGLPENASESQSEFYSYARKMKQTYGVVGEEKVEDRMQETFGLIASGQLQPPKQKKSKKSKK